MIQILDRLNKDDLGISQEQFEDSLKSLEESVNVYLSTGLQEV